MLEPRTSFSSAADSGLSSLLTIRSDVAAVLCQHVGARNPAVRRMNLANVDGQFGCAGGRAFLPPVSRHLLLTTCGAFQNHPGTQTNRAHRSTRPCLYRASLVA